jgi:NAD(P)-dependent dehydrogenase (short-subunit alcohol dehydrogenase family)
VLRVADVDNEDSLLNRDLERAGGHGAINPTREPDGIPRKERSQRGVALRLSSASPRFWHTAPMRITTRIPLCALVLLLVTAFAAPRARAETVLITGSNQGIGLEFAKEYAAKGWTVIATHRRDTTPNELAILQQQYPAKVRVERMDVTDPAQIKALALKLKGQPIDVLLNNAALIRFGPITDRRGSAGGLFGTLDYDQLDQFIHTNVAGPLRVTEAFIDNVRASRQKKIIAISSAAGMVSVPPRSADHYGYRISKAALNSAMRLLAVQFKDEGIIVAFFHPGGVQVESLGDLKLPGFVPPPEAVGKMIVTIDGLTLKDSGRFLQTDGRDQPW